MSACRSVALCDTRSDVGRRWRDERMEGERYKGDGEMKEWREKDIRVMER